MYSFLLFLFTISISCSKDEVKKVKESTQSVSSSSALVFDIKDSKGNNTKSERGKTILGIKRNNPFTITNMATAHNILYSTSISEMPTTDLYVKFTPNSVEELKALYATDEIFYDYPLEYEVLEMGDYYQELNADEFPILYTVVKPDFEFPDITHEVIANLYLSQENPRLIAEALLISSNATDIKDLVNFDLEDVAKEDMGRIPEIIICPDPNCTPKLRLVSNNGESPEYEWYCDCPPPPAHAECSTTGDVRRPYGQVRVEDTQLSNPSNSDSFEPVRRAKVIIRDIWFGSVTTETNDNGCFSFEHKFWGKVWIYVKFDSDRCSIRGAQSGINWPTAYLSPIKSYIGTAAHHDYSNIKINSYKWTTWGSKTHVLWGASTINNSINEFYDYANSENINATPSHLDVYAWIGNSNPEYKGTGFALMTPNMGATNTAIALTAGNIVSTSYVAVPFFFTTALALSNILPDVLINIDFDKSDKLKHLCYHELAHASHYTVVDDVFWMNVIAAELKADNIDGHPHGNPSSWEADRIALCESWAEHIGRSFAHLTYGVNNNVSTNDVSVLTYMNWLEKQRNETADHIPIGYYHDLIDNVNQIETAKDGDMLYGSAYSINDEISGLTNHQLFSLLDANVTSPVILTTKIKNSNYLTGQNTNQKLDNLFNSY